MSDEPDSGWVAVWAVSHLVETVPVTSNRCAEQGAALPEFADLGHLFRRVSAGQNHNGVVLAVLVDTGSRARSKGRSLHQIEQRKHVVRIGETTGHGR